MQGSNTKRDEGVKVTGLKVVAGMALDANDEVVWAEAVRLVRGTPHAELHVCHVVEDVDGAIESASDASTESLLDKRQAALTDFVNARLRFEVPRSWLRTVVHLGIGKPADELGQVAADVEADVIVVGAVGGRRIRDMILGSVAAELFKASPCSVTLARPNKHEAVDKTPEVEPPAAPGQGTPRRPHKYRYRRSLALRTPDAEVIPTGVGLNR